MSKASKYRILNFSGPLCWLPICCICPWLLCLPIICPGCCRVPVFRPGCRWDNRKDGPASHVEPNISSPEGDTKQDKSEKSERRLTFEGDLPEVKPEGDNKENGVKTEEGLKPEGVNKENGVKIVEQLKTEEVKKENGVKTEEGPKSEGVNKENGEKTEEGLEPEGDVNPEGETASGKTPKSVNIKSLTEIIDIPGFTQQVIIKSQGEIIPDKSFLELGSALDLPDSKESTSEVKSETDIQSEPQNKPETDIQSEPQNKPETDIQLEPELNFEPGIIIEPEPDFEPENDIQLEPDFSFEPPPIIDFEPEADVQLETGSQTEQSPLLHFQGIEEMPEPTTVKKEPTG